MKARERKKLRKGRKEEGKSRDTEKEERLRGERREKRRDKAE